MDRGQQVAQPVDAARLVGDELAAPTDEQPDLGVRLTDRFDRAQIATVSDAVGNHRGVARIAVVLATGAALAGPIDRRPRDAHDLDARLQSQRAPHAGDATDDVDADP